MDLMTYLWMELRFIARTRKPKHRFRPTPDSLILSLLVLKLGPGAADIVAHHAPAAIAIVGLLAVLGFSWWWIRRNRSGKLTTE